MYGDDIEHIEDFALWLAENLEVIKRGNENIFNKHVVFPLFLLTAPFYVTRLLPQFLDRVPFADAPPLQRFREGIARAVFNVRSSTFTPEENELLAQILNRYDATYHDIITDDYPEDIEFWMTEDIKMRWTRLLLTRHPRRLSRAVIRR